MENNMKKLLVLTFLFAFAFNTVCFAAVGSSKPRMSTPSRKPPATQQASPSNGGYQPSAPAGSYTDKAPAAKQSTPQTAQTPQQQPSSGGFLRNMGMFGGGMLLGGLLGGMLGFGNAGMFASLMGVLFNVLLVVGVFMAGRYLWDRFKRSREKANMYR
ncbi:MAG TPA: hypothetical protein PKA28_06070 [Methylomusa anaerophila]|uniref:Preprotein translocase subunit Tim44 n=1 Tax=Methylomusa anaerophila TaxID=1930071 RepID=A0A348ALP0_9FIRM|nr:hypothetical protein [Methylomusa anaerophila]BBB91988.1 hypothetical protein MAMMFC1_02673 [Methylomusa anaerophila]HML87999.1 hypothetical protein [Methylomusa anaerophila]